MARIEKDYRRAVVYQIYVKSFCDSDGDGLGDLPGIIGKLDYLERLGVDYLWLTPFFPSPQHDNGYDVSDYCAVDPRYGTMADFDELVAKAAEKGMGIMLDMVLCHTSVEHEWFRRACAGEERYQRYYILRDGRGASGPGDPGEPPTNWQCVFGGSAWKWEPSLGKWYLHMHDVSQPDLDWANPEVRAALADVVAEVLRRLLDDGVRVAELEYVAQRPDAVLHGLRAREVALLEELEYRDERVGIDVRAARDAADSARLEVPEYQRVVAREDEEVLVLRELDVLEHVVEVAAAVLYADDVRNVGELRDRRGLNRVSGARRYVVEDYRHIDGLGYRLEVRVNLVLRRGGVIGSNERKRIRSGFLRVERELYRRFRAGASGSGEDRDAPSCRFNSRLDDLFLLVGRHRVELAVRAEAEDARDARLDLAVDLIFEFFVVDALVIVHRRDDRGDDSSDFHWNTPLSLSCERCYFL